MDEQSRKVTAVNIIRRWGKHVNELAYRVSYYEALDKSIITKEDEEELEKTRKQLDFFMKYLKCSEDVIMELGLLDAAEIRKILWSLGE